MHRIPGWATTLKCAVTKHTACKLESHNVTRSIYIWYHISFFNHCLIWQPNVSRFYAHYIKKIKWSIFLNDKRTITHSKFIWQQCSMLKCLFFFQNLLYRVLLLNTIMQNSLHTLIFDSIPNIAEECGSACAVRAGFGLCLQQHCCWLMFSAVMSSLSGIKS